MTDPVSLTNSLIRINWNKELTGTTPTNQFFVSTADHTSYNAVSVSFTLGAQPPNLVTGESFTIFLRL